MYTVDDDDDGLFEITFDTFDECVQYGRAEYEGRGFWIGRVENPPSPERYIGFDDWVSNVAAQSEYAGDYSETWFGDIEAHEKELTEALQKTVRDWMLKHQLMPSFFLVEDVKYIPGADEHDDDQNAAIV